MTRYHIIRKVSVTAAHVATHSGYHDIGDHDRGVAMMAATADVQVGCHLCNFCVWSRHGWEYSLWLWGGFLVVLVSIQRVNFHGKAMSYIKIFNSGHGYYRGNIRISWKYPRPVDIIRILWIYQHYILGYYQHFLDISSFRVYYPHFVDISVFCG